MPNNHTVQPQQVCNVPKTSKPALRALNGADYFRLEQPTRVGKTDVSNLHKTWPETLGIFEMRHTAQIAVSLRSQDTKLPSLELLVYPPHYA